MQRQRISGIFADPQAFDGKEITVCGWARTTRDMKNFGFIELNDGSTVKSLQIVMEREKLAKDEQKLAKKLSNEGFLAKAAAEIIEKDRAKHAELADKIARIDEQLAELA